MKLRTSGAAWLVLCFAVAGCARVRSVVPWIDPKPPSPAEVSEKARDATEKAREEAHEKVARSPHAISASTRASAAIRTSALADPRLRVLVSTAERALWVMRVDSVLFAAPIAVGMQEGFTWAGKTYDFKTPHSKRSVLAKLENPIWIPPDWHYFELALQRKLTPVQLKRDQVIQLSDSTRIVLRGEEVGRVNRFGNYWPFDPGFEIIFDGKIFIPPLNSPQRRIPHVLGTHKLEIGNGYLIHGTNEETSIGEAVSHGCVRMFNADVISVYQMVSVGTPVYIF
jgi:hypothetical protein